MFKNSSRLAMCFGLLVIAACSSGSKSYVDRMEEPLNRQEGEIRKCHENAVAQGRPGEPAAEGEVELSVDVSPTGKVTNVSVIRSTMNSRKLETCVQEVARRATFPKSEDGRMTQFTRVYRFAPLK